VIVALNSLEVPVNQRKFVKGGLTAFDALLDSYVELDVSDGEYAQGNFGNQDTTDWALYALSSLYRSLETGAKHTRFFDFSDITPRFSRPTPHPEDSLVSGGSSGGASSSGGGSVGSGVSSSRGSGGSGSASAGSARGASSSGSSSGSSSSSSSGGSGENSGASSATQNPSGTTVLTGDAATPLGSLLSADNQSSMSPSTFGSPGAHVLAEDIALDASANAEQDSTLMLIVGFSFLGAAALAGLLFKFGLFSKLFIK
jgi:cobalamin biosynthesis Mg chelatase CobN